VRAVTIRDGRLVVAERPDPEPGRGELLVRVAMPVPDGLGWVEAGGFPEVFTTAHDALFTQCGLGLGDRLLVPVAATFPLDRAQDAYDRFAAGGKLGKLVLRI
jgi:NADPH:quinone reductase-like Zn-dependent oxidoreductase